MSRKITKVIIHCTASDFKHHDNVDTIRKWHVDENGWKDIGYHFVITKDGNVHKTRDIQDVGAHAKGHNLDSIGVCLTGDKKFSPDQYFSLAWLLHDLMENNPEVVEIKPHNHYDNDKTCPNFELRIFTGGK